MRMLAKIKNLRQNWRWTRANHFMSIGKEVEAIAILKSLKMQNGPKQIALVQLGNCNLRINAFSEALLAYEEAIVSERQWSGRKSSDVSEYVITYAHFFKESIASDHSDEARSVKIERYEKLLSLNVPASLKTSLLPLPPRSLLTPRY